ncbi:bifunctional (p)ppGpp synthetase/guanosine-3',5'-bis(diphosphate) 3'-pyrophosphohydrolase [Megalodesulfovibrio paquesii]
MPDEGRALIQKAYVYSAAAHQGQVRASGEPYLLHPLEVANILAEMKLDEATIAAGLLHDTVEDTLATIEEIDSLFGEEVADIVDGVTKLAKLAFDSKEQAQAESLRKMIMAMAEDMRVLIVKLADRLHNMRTLEHMPPEKRQRIAQETMDIYAPLANRLGLHRIKVELEDLAFRYLKPDVFTQVADGVKSHQTLGKDYMINVTSKLEAMLAENGIRGRVHGRTKHLYSIYRKMEQQHLTLDQVYDLIAFRVIVNTIKDCYAMLGLVHAEWRPIPGKFKDYISLPKANMYQSLHTTVIGPLYERIEIQIRTEEMHRYAEHGVAAHWLYKDSGKLKAKDLSQFSWLREMLDWQKEESDSREFLRSLRIDLFKDEVYVFTPKGDVKELPEGATPVDFAYQIHTQVGDRCTGAKVNGRLVPLTTELKNGDVVEIFTDSQRRPNRDWLKFVKTAKARTRINYYIRTEERVRSIALAKEMLEKEGRKLGVNFGKLLKDKALEPLAAEMTFKSVDDLLSAVGYARITPGKIIKRFLPQKEEDKPTPKAAPGEKRPEKGQSKSAEATAEELRQTRPGEAIIIDGVDDVLQRFALCCNPLPGDAIIGYISRGKGLTVHRADCPNVQGLETDRLIAVSWPGEVEAAFPSRIRILARNKPGVLAKVSSVLSQEGVNIESGNFHSSVDGTTEMIFTVTVKEATLLYKVLDKVNHLDAIVEAVRLTTPVGTVG